MDTVAGAKSFDDLSVPQSTISRYACRIVVSRSPPYTARIFAAGFDGSKNIFLGVRRTRAFFSSGRYRRIARLSLGKIDQMEERSQRDGRRDNQRHPADALGG